MSYVGNVISDGDNNLVGSTLYGVCSTAAATAAKVVTLSDYDAIIEGTTLHVKFIYSNAASEPTLNVNGTGAYPLYTDGVNYPGNTAVSSWPANAVLSLTFDGTAWRMNDAGANYESMKSDLLSLVYPVGAIYMSVNSTSPSTLFGGTWVQIKDTFLLAAGTSHAAGATGGAETVTLTTGNLPAHNHQVGAHAHGLNSHVHSLNSHVHSLSSHVHSFSGSGSTGNAGVHSHEIFSADYGSGETWGYKWESTASGGSSDGVYSAGNHSHSVSVSGTTGGPSTANTGASSGNTGAANGSTANSTAFNTGNTGSGNAVDKMPPYLAVYCWKRTA